MFELSGVNYEEVLEQGDSILVRVIASSSYRGFELSGLYCITKSPLFYRKKTRVAAVNNMQRKIQYTKRNTIRREKQLQ